jgi:hypothetical protein
MSTPPDSHWQRVWAAVRTFAHTYPEDVIAVGGVAVYLHARAAADADLPEEYTHDADVCVALTAWSDIRDAHEVTANRRLSKHQLVIDGVEFDVYLEHSHALRLDYAELAHGAVTIDGVRVAGLEHLLLLKLSAFRERGQSAHGRKDRRDIAKLLVLLDGASPRAALAHASDDDVVALSSVLDSDAFAELAAGNAHHAARLRKRASGFVAALRLARP